MAVVPMPTSWNIRRVEPSLFTTSSMFNCLGQWVNHGLFFVNHNIQVQGITLVVKCKVLAPWNHSCRLRVALVVFPGLLFAWIWPHKKPIPCCLKPTFMGFSGFFIWFFLVLVYPLVFLNLAGHALTPCFGGSGSRVGAKGGGGKGAGIFPSRNRVLDIPGWKRTENKVH